MAAMSKETRAFIEHYEERLLEFAGASAIYGRSDPETALWNARRAAEAMCLIALCALRNEPIANVRGKKYGSMGLEKLLSEVDGLVDPARTHFTRLQMATNLGAHVRHDGREALRETVDSVHEDLRVALRWTYDVGPAAAFLVQQQRAQAVGQQLQLASAGQLTPHLQLAEAERLLRDIGAERAATLARIANAEARATAAETELKRLRDERGRVQDLARRVSRARWWNRLYAAGGVGVGLTLGLTGGWCVGAVAGFVAPDPTAVVVGVDPSAAAGEAHEAAPEAPAGDAVAAAPPAPAPGAPVIVAMSLPPAPSAAAPPAPEPPPPACPAGMVEVQGRTLRLRQPERPTWPGHGVGELPPIDVSKFCLDPSPARWSDTIGDVRAARAKCGKASAQIACALTRDEAEAACRARGARLPRVAEWEVALRNEAKIAMNSKGKEWVEDRFPPRVLGFSGPAPQGDGLWRYNDLRGRVEGGEPWWSWNQQPPDPREAKAGFRCAADLGGAGG